MPKHMPKPTNTQPESGAIVTLDASPTGETTTVSAPRGSAPLSLAAFFTGPGANGNDPNNICRFAQFHTDSTGYNIYTNTHAQQCLYCKQWQANHDALEAHQKQYQQTCERCWRQEIIFCGAEDLWWQYPYCQWSCGEHNRCFTGLDKMLDHARKYMHERCFFDSCRSDHHFEACTDEVVVRHVFTDHRHG